MAVPASRSAGLRGALPFLGLAVAIWALLPPYTGAELATEMRVEIADHVVPSILMIVLSLTALVRDRRAGAQPGSFMLLAGLGILLAGFWMVATHVPLVGQYRRDEVPGLALSTVAHHTAPGVAVMLLGLVWAALYWNDASSET